MIAVVSYKQTDFFCKELCIFSNCVIWNFKLHMTKRRNCFSFAIPFLTRVKKTILIFDN